MASTPGHPLRVGTVILPDQRWADGGDRWRRAEELGLDHAWTYDHLSWRDLRDGPWFGTVPTLAAAALSTQRIGLGTLVASPNFRHPVPLAKDAMSLDDLSGGRFVLGVGAGGSGWDAGVLGQDPLSAAERVDRFEDFVDLLDRLLRYPSTTHTGDHYSAVEARMIPGCLVEPRLPLGVAATGPRSMRLAARAGEWWITVGPAGHSGEPLRGADAADALARQVAQLEDACAAVGRDPAELRRLALTGFTLGAGLGSPDEFADTCGRYADAGITDLVVHWPRPDGPFAGDQAAFERAVTA